MNHEMKKNSIRFDSNIYILFTVESLTSATSTGSICNCLPSCSEIEYGFNKISLGHKLKQNKSRYNDYSIIKVVYSIISFCFV